MAVYRQRYTEYTGELTLPAGRFWILTRYAFRELVSSRIILVLSLASLLPLLAGGAFIYIAHNLDVLLAFDITIQSFIAINGEFFATIMGIQYTLAFIMAAVAGPGLVSPDLTNGALPLYLSRPFSRTEYVLGKFAVLAVLISAISWVPGLLLYIMQGALAGDGWLFANGRIAMAIFVASWTWIATIALLSLALSAWVRWRPIAGGMLFFIFFASSVFGPLVNEILRARWGAMLSLGQVIEAIGEWLFTGTVTPFLYPLPIWTAWFSLSLVWAASLFMLWRKIRAYEVVR